MPHYTLFDLPIPTGFVNAYPVKINSNGQIAGTCGEYYGRTSAMVWNSSGYQVIGPPGLYSYATDINSQQIVTGDYIDNKVKYVPFYWDKNTGVLTELNVPNQDSNGLGTRVSGLNDNNEIVGRASQSNSGPSDFSIFWTGLNANPIAFGSKTEVSWTIDINNNGIVIGSIYNSTDFQGFYGDSVTQIQNLIPNSRGCSAINDLAKPQILFYWNTGGVYCFRYDTSINKVYNLNTPGNETRAHDINNSNEIAGETVIDGAVIWKGLIKIKLNHPLISDAKIKGWNLTRAISINDNGLIVGTGSFGGKELPFLLIPKQPKVPRIRVEYMLPHLIWPGEAYDRPKPRGWPKQFPFPLPEPSPFELVGEAHEIQQNLMHILKVRELVNNIPDEKDGAQLRKIVIKIIEQKSQKLNNLIEKSLLVGSQLKK